MSDKLKDNWRFTYIGDREWIIDNYFSFDPEIRIIDALDNNDVERFNSVMTVEIPSELHDYIESLPERYQAIIWNYYFEGKTLEAIGQERGFSKQYAHQQLCKAIQLLKNLFKENK